MTELVGMQHRIDDGNYQEYAGVNGVVEYAGEKRYLSCKYGKVKPGFVSLPQTFKVIPQSDHASRARDLLQAKADLMSTTLRSGRKRKDQNGISYCHAHATASGIEVVRDLQGESYADLSPSFIGNLVTNFQNAGAYIEDDLEVAVKYGCCTTEFVPMNSLTRNWYNQNKEATFANAALHKIDNWVNLGYASRGGELDSRVKTCLLQRIPVVVALNWWGHAILYLNVFENGDYGFENSWGDGYGEKGMGRLSASRGSPSAAWIPSSCIASLL